MNFNQVYLLISGIKYQSEQVKQFIQLEVLQLNYGTDCYNCKKVDSKEDRCSGEESAEYLENIYAQ